MPLMFPALIGAVLFISPISSFAEDGAQIAAEYARCLAETRAEIKNALMARCAQAASEAAIAECNSRIADPQLDEAKIAYCKLKSGVTKSTSEVCTTEEADKAAQEQRKREETLGIAAAEEPPKTMQLFGNEGPPPGASPSPKRNVPVPTPRPVSPNTRADTGRSSSAPDTPQAAQRRTASARPATDSEQGTPSSANSSSGYTGIYADPASAQAQANADIARCQSTQSQASLCCNNPLSCASSSDQAAIRQLGAYAQSGDQQGLVDYCRQMQSLGDSSGSINSRLGAICTNNQYACSNTCSSLEQKYRQYMATCENCESYSVFSNAAATLASARSSCSQLSVRADALVRQGLSTASNSAYGDYCQQVAASSPQNSAMAGMPGSGSASPAVASTADPFGCAANPNSPACLNCNQNPNSPACAKAAMARGDAGFRSAAEAQKNAKFNLPELDDSGIEQPLVMNGAESAAVKVQGVPNGGGGGIPGAGATQASLGSANRSGSTGGAGRSYTTEVEQGFRSGGYSQPAGSGTSTSTEYYQGRGSRRPADNGNSLIGVDLKQYLPGGSRDPGRRLAGAAVRSEINAKEEDIWRIISIKFYEKCRLGILWHCN